MKTQEEIVIYAVDYAKSIGNEDGTAAFDYAKGYNQCQKDLSNSWTKGCECESSIGQTWCCNQCGLPYDTRKSDKKYTEAQMKACFYHNCIDNPEAMFEDYLKKYVNTK